MEKDDKKMIGYNMVIEMKNGSGYHVSRHEKESKEVAGIIKLSPNQISNKE